MKALSIQQPYAFAIVVGYKDVENRTWRHSHRGPTLIHTGKKELIDDVDGVLRSIAAQRKQPLDVFERGYRKHRILGAIVGAANIVDCVSRSESPWFYGPHAFVLDGAQRIFPVAWRGERGFFEVPGAVLDRTAEDGELRLRGVQ